MLSFLHAVFIYLAVDTSPWLVEQYLVRTTMLVVGLIVLLCWESTFPDRTDLAVLGALP